MCSIIWSGFTWQVFATLATGAMAVGSALRVASRQIIIAKRQAEIAEQQAATALMAQREKLFDRRFAVYMELQKYLKRTLELRAPGSLVLPHQKLFDALQRAQFLFDAKVLDSLHRVIELVNEYESLRPEYPDDDTDVEKAARRKLLNEKRIALRERSNSLAMMFGEEMRLHQSPNI